MRAFRPHAVEYCLREAGITAAELDLVGFYEKPLVKFTRLIETYIACAPRGWRSVPDGDPAVAERKALDGGRHRQPSSRATRVRSSSANTTNRTPRRHSIHRPSNRLRSSPLTAWGSGPPRRSALAGAMSWSSSASFGSRIRSACSTPPSRTSPAFASIPANTRSWGSRPTANRNT